MPSGAVMLFLIANLQKKSNSPILHGSWLSAMLLFLYAIAFSFAYLTLGAGTDIAPLLQGLEHDLCAAPHWGYVITGRLVLTYADQDDETVSGVPRIGRPSGWPAQ